MQLWDTQARANSARATPHEDQELIRTLDLSLLARKNSFGLSQLDKENMFHSLGILILTSTTLLNFMFDYALFKSVLICDTVYSNLNICIRYFCNLI